MIAAAIVLLACGASPPTDEDAGILDPNSEICGDGLDNDGDGNIDCRDSDCDCPDCGNGVVDPNEQCDDGNAFSDDDCLQGCVLATCGDSFVDQQEADVEDCDEGGNTATCDYDCTFAECGDGIVNEAANETCDTPSGANTEDCDADCTAVACGDGIANLPAGEECDDAGESATCDIDCTLPVCGDDVVNMTAGELCDDSGMDTATCDADCTAVVCGDGLTNMVANEECDDSGESAVCDPDCTAVVCGDNTVNMTANEECDQGGVNTAICDFDCTLPVCGDALANALAGEACDDGGMNTAACDSDCTFPVCGDGLLNIPAGEQCDDGNAVPDDECDNSCQATSDPQCLQPYTQFTTAERNITFNDGDLGVEFCDSSGVLADPEWLGLGWYRFTAAAGTQMPTSSQPIYSCGTDAPGWLNGAHPAIGDGVVARQVCFHWSSNTCNWSANIQVVNCGGFFLYELPETPECYLRYCGSI